MKKILAVVAAMVLSVPSFAQFSSGGFDLDKENLYYGFRIGLNVSSLSGLDKTPLSDLNSKAGLNFAGIIGLHISSSAPVFLESGVYYSEYGAKKDDVKVSYNNLEFPILVKYGFKANHIAILPFLGPTFSYAFSGKTKQYSEIYGEYEKVGTFDEKEAKTGGLKRFNMGFKLGCGAEYENIYFEVGYRFGITNVAKEDDYSIRSNALFVNLGVNF